MMTCRYIGPDNGYWKNGRVYSVSTQAMTGKVYKDLNDQEGKPDTRIMLWSTERNNENLKVFESNVEIDKVFERVN